MAYIGIIGMDCFLRLREDFIGLGWGTVVGWWRKGMRMFEREERWILEVIHVLFLFLFGGDY